MNYLGNDLQNTENDQQILEEIEDLSIPHGIKTGIHDGFTDLTKYTILGAALLIFSQTIWPQMGKRLRKRYL